MVPEHLTKWLLLELQMIKDREFLTHGVKIKHQMTILGVLAFILQNDIRRNYNQQNDIYKMKFNIMIKNPLHNVAQQRDNQKNDIHKMT